MQGKETKQKPQSNFREVNLTWYERHSKLLILKRRIALEFKKVGKFEIADKLFKCGEWDTLCACGSCGGYWWVRYRCTLRCCPICSRDKARDRTRYLLAVSRKQIHCKMLTLTMKRWTGSPGDGIKHLRDSVQRIRDTTLFARCLGGAYTIEVIPKDDGWHIHAHMVIDAPYMPFRTIVAAWALAVRQPCPHVRIQSAESENVKKYICKYAGKSMVEDIGLAHIVEWYEAIKGRRLWATFGLWYNAKLNDLEDGEEEKQGPRPCPLCGQTKCVFLARAGPAIMGREWKHFCHGDLLLREYDRPNDEIVNYLDNLKTNEPQPEQENMLA